MAKTDLQGLEDIRLMVDEFYGKVKEDSLIGPVFFERIQDDWQPHLEKMYRFWNAVLFGQPGFVGNPFARHATLPIKKEHFDRWLLLFKQTVDDHFSGSVAEEAKKRANIMAAVFQTRLEGLGGKGSKVIV